MCEYCEKIFENKTELLINPIDGYGDGQDHPDTWKMFITAGNEFPYVLQTEVAVENYGRYSMDLEIKYCPICGRNLREVDNGK